MAILTEFLTDIANAIRYKKRTTAKINAKNFASEIITIQTNGECDRNHIIEVDTLPTENIDENALYKVGDTYYKYAKEVKDIIVITEGVAQSVFEIMSTQGVNCVCYFVDNYENVENPIPYMNTDTMTMTYYYDESRNDAFMYDDEWISYSITSGMPAELITDNSQAINDGMYVLAHIGWKIIGGSEYNGKVVIS